MYNLLYMLRRLQIVFSIAFFLFTSLFILSRPVHAQLGIDDYLQARDYLDTLQDTLDAAGTTAYQAEFCERRQGDQMNLETWYSGKCVEDSLKGEGVGFSDIVLLDLMERVQGRVDPEETLFDKLEKMVNFVREAISQGKSEDDIKLALLEKKTDVFYVKDGGIIGSAGKGMAFMINNPPASTKNYVAYITQNLQRHRVIPQALAQTETTGYGYSGLGAFLPIWKMFRNLAYMIFVIFFILYGFMMMFRVNISAKTVITVQLALPKLIATLLMITFSYAIVGLMVDLMYVIFYAFISLMAQQNLILAEGWLVTPASGQLGALLSFVVNTFAAIPASAIGVINLILGGPSVFSAALSVIGALSGIGLIIMLIIVIAIAISYLRLLWKLLTAFLSVIIALITAPIVLLANAMPGSNTFGNWMRGIFANLSVFPITMVLLTFSYMLMVQPIVNIGGQYHDGPIAFGTNFLEWFFGVKSLNPGGFLMYVPFVSPPLSAVADFMGNAPDAMLALFGIALLLMASKYVDIVRDALKVPPFKYGTAISDALKYGMGTNEKWAGKDYFGLPGALGRGARGAYSRGVDASGAVKGKPSLFLGGKDTGITSPK